MKRSHAHFRTLAARRKRRVCAPTGLRRLRFEPLEARRLMAIVNTLVDEDNGIIGGTSLREAIATASPGETITFDPSVSGTIVLTLGELVIDKGLTINGPGASLLTIDAQQSSRVLNIT